MDEKCCVFWFPSIYHNSINERLQRFEIEKPITDFNSVAKLKVSIDYSHEGKNIEEDIKKARKDTKLIEKTLRFEVYKINDNGDKENIFSSFELKYVDHSNNGMVVYSYQEPDDYPKGENKPPFEKALKTIFYHCAKSLFHNHEVQTDRDSGLEAYIAESDFDPKQDIKKPDNKAIKYFLSQYEIIFMNYAERASRLIGERDAVLAKFEGKITLPDNGFYSGYLTLTRHGWSDFSWWYEHTSDKQDVIRCQKDVQSWRLIINPPYKRRKRRLQHYFDRYEKIVSVLGEIVKNNPTDENIIEYRIVEKCNAIGEKLKAWEEEEEKEWEEEWEKEEKREGKKESFWNRLTKKDTYPIHKMLRICEIGLSLCRFPKFKVVLFHRLKKYYLDLPILTEETRRRISMLCEGALTEYVYCKTLLESKYNTQVTHTKLSRSDSEPNRRNEDVDIWRKKACNIRNSIRYIETVKYRCINAQSNSVNMTLRKSDLLSRNGKIWTFIGIVLAVLGIVLTIKSL